jgi:manganese/zinc/iron transport system permease protein
MNSGQVILLTGILVASASALPGCFLLLRRLAMMADAISHAILPGIVAGYFIARGPNLLAGFAGAALAAAVTVALVEALGRTGRVAGQAAIGIVFPALFALGTVLVSRFFANVHLDTDAVLYGNIEFAAFEPLIIGDFDLGPQSLWIMGGLCVINLAFVLLFYKELKLATFDPGLAAALGFSPVLIHYALMGILSVTAVGAFTAVGAILVVALMIIPAATAYLLTDRLPVMIALAVALGATAAVLGYGVAVALDASVAGAMATMAGILFGLAFLFAPEQGLVARARRQARQRRRFAVETLIVHLLNHEGAQNEATESAVAHLGEELRWADRARDEAIARAAHEGLLARENGHLALTDDGRAAARAVMAR